MKRNLTILTVILLLLSMGYTALAQNVEAFANVVFRPDERVFATLCAMHAAGYSYGMEREAPSSFRRALLASLGGRRVDAGLKERMGEFYRRHNVELDDLQQAAKYSSFALLLGPAPGFEYRIGDRHPPESVQALAGFEALVADYGRQVKLSEIWAANLPNISAYWTFLRGDVMESVRAVLGYSRVPAKLYLNRRIVVVPDVVNAPNVVNAVHLDGEYFVIASMPTSPDRYRKVFVHEYLHFLLDPSFEAKAARMDKDDALRAGLAKLGYVVAPGHDPSYYVRESLIWSLERAVFAAQNWQHPDAPGDGGKRDAPFAPGMERRMASFGKSGKDLVAWTEGMLADLKLDELLKEALPAPTAPVGERKPEVASAPAPDPRIQALEKAEQLVKQGRGAEAEDLMAPILAANPGDPMALFTLGQVRFAAGAVKEALDYYERAAAAKDVPAWIRGWSLVRSGYCLGRLERREEALERFRKAAALEGDSRGAAEAARRALDSGKE